MKFTNEIIIEKGKQLYGDNYDYSQMNYNGSKSKLKIVCKKCNSLFIMRADYFLSGHQCPYCYSNRYNLNKFIKEANKIHNNKYSYSKTVFTTVDKKVKIICPKHGEFEQVAHSHLLGNGCPICGIQRTTDFHRKSNTQFIKEAKLIHDNKYDYSLTNYICQKNKIKIKCNNCSKIFEQLPLNHLKGEGCPCCNHSGKSPETTEGFIIKAKQVHGNKYDYSLVNYINCYEKVKIICPIHGIFKQSPTKHLSHGCPICKESKGEQKIRNWLTKNNISFEAQKCFKECKGISNYLPFDFYIKEKNLLIEYQGIQHYKPIKIFGGIDTFNRQKELDNIKKNFAANNNFNFLEISYKDFNKVEIILENEIKKKINQK